MRRTGIVATGHNRQVYGAIWSEVDFDGRRGWANGQFLVQLGATEDITERLAGAPEGLPRAADLMALAEAVGARRSSEPPAPRIVVVEQPEIGTLGSVMVDVLDLPR